MNWLNSQKFRVMEWPPQSSDLSPIKNLQSFLKIKLAKYENPPSGINELWERIEDNWEATPSSYVANLYDSKPNRMADLKKSKVYGDNTKKEH